MPGVTGPTRPAGQAPRPGTGLTDDGVTAQWVIDENNKPGTPDWPLRAQAANNRIEGFADQTAATHDQQVALYVSTTAPKFHVEAYRMGYYHGAGARLVWRSADLPGRAQPPCPVRPTVNMVACDNWSPSTAVTITPDFVPGDYLFKLVGSGGEQNFLPLTVWDPDSHAAYLVKNDVLTWQAWNTYGGYDYYVGVGDCPANVYPLCSRARTVSFDRPYGDGQGTGDFMELELPLVRFMEQRGLDVSYATDLTVITHPDVLLNHRAVLSLGHDECWELRERQAAVAAHNRGVNIAFFGASPVLRHVRLQDSQLGPNREEVDYRDSRQDPLNGHGSPLEVTGNTWGSPPANWPESDFVGDMYNGFLGPDAPPANFTVVDSRAWIFQGTGLADGSVLPGVIRSDVDHFDPGMAHPANVEIFGHSSAPIAQAQPNSKQGNVFYSDMTYYTDPASKAGMFDSGTNNWIPALEQCPASAAGCPVSSVGRITGNLFRVFGQGPAGATQPSVPNWQRIYPASH
jgi:N,N-dimethylformamidase beta subunit-like, C-terminal